MRRQQPARVLALTLALVLAACSGQPSASPQASANLSTNPPITAEPFDAAAYFQGKTVALIAVSGVGGGVDRAMRYVVEHLGDFIPGNPRLTATNIDQVAGYNHVYNAPPDGLTIGVAGSADGLIQREYLPESDYDMTMVRVLAGHVPSVDAYLMHGDLPYESILDAIGSDGPPMVYPNAVGGVDDMGGERLQITWSCDRLDIPCTFLQVADDDDETIALMFARGEASLAGTPLSTMAIRGQFAELEAGTLKLYAVVNSPEGGLADVLPEAVPEPPDLRDVIPEEHAAEWAIIEAATQSIVGNFYFFGPDVPDEIVRTLQQAFEDMMADPEIAAGFEDVKQTDMTLIPGPQAEQRIHEGAEAFAEGRDTLRMLQQELWDKYWAQ